MAPHRPPAKTSAEARRGRFRFAGGDARTTVIGATGSGKSTCGLWMLANQRLDARPWIAIDHKREVIFDLVGFPPIQPLGLGDDLPRRPGLYLCSPRPDEDEATEAFLWRIWEHENIGLYIDEAALMPDASAFPAILQQGRSKRLPVIACTQRPVSVARGLFSEANFFALYRMVDKRDYRTVEGFVPGDLDRPLPARHWYWYDRDAHTMLHMGPVPAPPVVAAQLSNRLPVHLNAWHPFAWSGRPSADRLN
jgi:hypothetical protein